MSTPRRIVTMSTLLESRVTAGPTMQSSASPSFPASRGNTVGEDSTTVDGLQIAVIKLLSLCKGVENTNVQKLLKAISRQVSDKLSTVANRSTNGERKTMQQSDSDLLDLTKHLNAFLMLPGQLEDRMPSITE
jgi:hypothetical protein